MIIKALILGFSTGLSCLGYCAPILGPLMLTKKEANFKTSACSLGLFTLGRLLAYLLFGLILGLVSRQTKDILFIQRRILPAVFILLGLLMILYGATKVLDKAKICAVLNKAYFKKGQHLLVMGFLAGINICPPFLLAMTYAFSLGQIVKSMTFFFFFFLATSLFFLPFLFSGKISRFEDVRAAAKISSIIAGVWFIFIAVKTLSL